MQFTYNAYENLINRLYEKGYAITNYYDFQDKEKCAILRHDIDYDLKKALPFAELEADNNAKSTYFVLVTSDFYNIFSKESAAILEKIQNFGHEIGLHFDEVRYMTDEKKWDKEETIENIIKEAEILGNVIGKPVKSVSMHRPSKYTLESNLIIPGLVNSYGQEFFKNFKYVSDSRMRWREDINEIIDCGEYKKLHILTHAFWYSCIEETISEKINLFIEHAKYERKNTLNDNITDLSDLITVKR